MGTWPIYKKTLPTTDLYNKKTPKKPLSFEKISPRDFYFFSFLFNLYLSAVPLSYNTNIFELSRQCFIGRNWCKGQAAGFSVEMPSYQYRKKSNYGDKTVTWPFYFHNDKFLQWQDNVFILKQVLAAAVYAIFHHNHPIFTYTTNWLLVAFDHIPSRYLHAPWHMMTSSNGNIFRFDVFFDFPFNIRENKQSRSRWFETPSHSLWRRCNASRRRFRIQQSRQYAVNFQHWNNNECRFYKSNYNIFKWKCFCYAIISIKKTQTGSWWPLRRSAK